MHRQQPEKPEKEIISEIQAIIRQVPPKACLLQTKALLPAEESDAPGRSCHSLHILHTYHNLAISVSVSHHLRSDYVSVTLQITASVTFLPLLNDPCRRLPDWLCYYHAL